MLKRSCDEYLKPRFNVPSNLLKTLHWEPQRSGVISKQLWMRIIIIFFKNTFNYPATWLQNYYSTCSHKSVLCFVPSCFVAFTGKWSHITFLLFRSGSCLDVLLLTHSDKMLLLSGDNKPSILNIATLNDNRNYSHSLQK